MTRLLAIPIALSIAACSTHSIPQSNRAPVPAALPATTAELCPPLEKLADGRISTLVSWAADSALLYAACQAKHASAVKSYDVARDAAIAADGERADD